MKNYYVHQGGENDTTKDIGFVGRESAKDHQDGIITDPNDIPKQTN